MNWKDLIWKWLPVVVWCGLIFWLSSIPHLRVSQQDATDLILRKTAHMAEYAILALLVYRAIVGFKQWRWTMVLVALLLAWLYSMSDEWHQHFIEGRSGNIRDSFIDLIGIVIGLAWLRWWIWWNSTLEKIKP